VSWIEDSDLKQMVGATVAAIYISEEYLTFETDRGLFGFTVEGDCCSNSYFFDFHGVEHLLSNGPVLAFEEVELSPGDPGYRPSTWQDGTGDVQGDYVRVYGYRLTTEHLAFGPVSSVFSFRNLSNGYYGGWMLKAAGTIRTDQRRVVRDVIDVEKFMADGVVQGETAVKEIER
jgi:hypothetical protein